MKKWISLLLAALLLFPAGVSAPTGAASAFPEEPAAVAEPAELENTDPEAPAEDPEEIYTCETREEAIRFIRAQMTARVAVFSLRCAEETPITSEDIVAYEGSAPDEGDYLRFNIEDLPEIPTNGEIPVQAKYRTSAVQEQELNAVIAEILASCDFSALTDYQKALWAFDAVCDNVTYAAEDAGETAYTAYGALLEHKARCQGYALAYYRLARALGVDCRILVGETTEDGITDTHAWNAVKLGESWYYVDATSGASAGNRYEWFLSPLSGEGFEVNVLFDADVSGTGDDSKPFYTADEIRDYTFNEPISGNCNETVRWTLDPMTGLLRIDGEGEVKAFPDGELYWREYDKIISVAFIAPTVTALWDGSFEGCAYPLHAVPGSAAESCIMENALPHHTLTLTEEIPATCAETGRTEGWKCDACNIFFTGNELIPTNDDHSDADGNEVCDVCDLPLNSFADGLCGDALRWYYYDRGELIVTGTGNMYNYSSTGKNAAPWASFRASIRTVSVWSGVETLGNNAFYGCTALTKISLPDTVTEIGNNAFSGCTSLSEITLPEQLKKLGYNAFKNTAFTTVTIPASLSSAESPLGEGPFTNSAVETAVFAEGATVVSYGLFASAKNLKTLVFRTPETMQKIDNYAFCRCTSLTSLSLPAGITEIGVNAFLGCTSLSEIALPEQLKKLGYNAFKNTAFTTVTIPASLSSAESPLGEGPFTNSAVETAVFAEGTVGVPANLFLKAVNLNTVSFLSPETVTFIGNYAFSGCTSLSEITLPGQLKKLGYNAFKNTAFTTVTIPASLTESHDSQLEGPFANSAVETAVFAEGATVVSYGLFASAKNLKTLVFRTPETMKKIDNYAFCRCTSLTSLSLPAGITEIGVNAFLGCTSLSEIALPEQLKKLGYNAFKNTAFTTVTIPASLTESHDSQLEGPFANSAVVTAVFAEGATVVAYGLFASAKNLKTLIFRTPETMQKIDNYAFCRCTSLTSLSLPDSIAEIGNCAFSGCTSLSEITLPEQLKKLGYNAFKNTAFTTVTIPASLSSAESPLGEGPFTNSAVETAVFAEGTVGVPANLFEKAINLNVVEFLSPETVTSIGSNAFRGCSSLSSFIVPENVTKLNSYAFSDCAGLLSVYVPNALLTPGANAFKNCSSLLVVHCPAGANAETYAANNGITCHTDLRYDTQPITLCNNETVTSGAVYCRVCERLLTQKSLITPDGHVEAEIPAVKATCKAEGRTAGKECRACKTVLLEPETIPKTDHIPVKDPAKPPTCTKNGLTAGSHCAYCNAVLVEREVVMATGHFDTLTEGEEPDGVCDICGRKAEESRVTYAIRRVGALFEGWLRLLSRLLRLFSKTKP